MDQSWVRRMSRSSTTTTALISVCLVAGAWWSAPGFEAAMAQDAETMRSMCGTISALDGAAREMRVITGVGHSLRVVVFRIERGCRIRLAGAEGRLDDLARGQIVVVAYRTTPDGYKAESIELGPPPPERGRR